MSAIGTIIGHLGSDADLKFSAGGSPVLNFSVASKTRTGKDSTTTWWRCALWGKRAEAIAGFMTKGKHVAVSGSLYSREYVSDGQKRLSLECNVSEVELLSGIDKQREAPPPAPAQGTFGDDDDSLPF